MPDNGSSGFDATQMAARTPPATTELRGECPRRIVNVLDAISMARDKTRTALVNEILGAWADEVLHEHSLVRRVLGSNPTESESTGPTQNRGGSA